MSVTVRIIKCPDCDGEAFVTYDGEAHVKCPTCKGKRLVKVFENNLEFYLPRD